MKRVVYLNNYLSKNVIDMRNNKNIFSQAANNKILGIINSLQKVGCDLEVISSGLVNSKSFKKYGKVIDDSEGYKIIYAPIWDIPFINTITSIFYTYKIIKSSHLIKKIDNIIFYNYKPEVAWVAWLAKSRLGISITVEIEDGYRNVEGISGIKKYIFDTTEKIVGKCIDSAICVNPSLSKDMYVPNVIVRGVVNDEIVKLSKNHSKSQRNKPKLMFSSTLDEVRGIDILLEALKYTSKEFELLISGRDDRGMCKYCKDPRVEYLGFLSYEKLQYYLLDADILLQCQLENSEFSQASFPSKIFEYIATGNLIISSSMSDVVEFAGDSFIFYQNDSPKELARAIDKAITSLEKNKLHQEIDKLVQDNLPDKVGKRILEVLN